MKEMSDPLQAYFGIVTLPANPNDPGSFNYVNYEFDLRQILVPRPWVNVMSNGSYGLVLSHFGGGFSWVGNSQIQRLTRWEQDLVLDQYGRYIYVYDLDAGELQSTTFAPVRELALRESVRFGLGYTVFSRDFATFSTEHAVFIPREGNREHWVVTITNTTSVSRRFRLGGYLEWILGNNSDWHREFHRLFVSLDSTPQAIFAWKRRGLQEGTRELPETPAVAYMSVHGLDGVHWFSDKAQFVGRQGRLDRPEAVFEATEPNLTGRWDDPVGAFTSAIELPPGESRTFVVTIGLEATHVKCEEKIADVTLSGVVAELEATKAEFIGQASALKIQTQVRDFDLMNNGWLPHQAETGRIHARSAYYQQGGAYGYRDQLQDSLLYLDVDPSKTLAQLKLHAEAMYEDGGVRHWWHPGTTIYHDSIHSDTCLWLAFGMLEYLEETADFGALDIECGYLSRATKKLSSTGTMLDHMMRGIKRCLSLTSDRGIPLIGGGDWNDGLSHAGIDGVGESVWVAMFLYDILTRLSPVLVRRGDQAGAEEALAHAKRLKEAVETHGWDGQWYIAGTSDNEKPFGSSQCDEGSIFLNPQTWAVITGIGCPERCETAMDQVRKQLVKPYGALLLAPAFRNVDPYVGYITRYAPGLRENGGVYSHASTWAVRAFAQMGDMATAFELYMGMLPTRGLQDSDRYQAEPFVMPGNVDGPDSPFESRAGWTWYTGSAAWMRRVALHWLIGVRPAPEGLLFDCHPPIELGTIRLERPFRGDVFEIEIEPGTSHTLYVDGQPFEGNIVPASGQGRRRKVHLRAK